MGPLFAFGGHKVKAHNLEAIGSLRLHFTPTDPNHAVRKADLDALVSSTSAKPVFVTDVAAVSDGNVGNKQYADTTPPNQILEQCVTDTLAVRVHFRAEGQFAFQAPAILVNGQQPDSIEGVEGDSHTFVGYADLQLTDTTEVQVQSSLGTSTTVRIVMAATGPGAASIEIGSLPGNQTAVKAGDSVSVTGTVENAAIAMYVHDSGAAVVGEFVLGPANSAGDGLRTFSGTVMISGRSGDLPINVYAENQLGTKGDILASAPITLDQAHPTVDITLGEPSNGWPYLGLNDTVEVAVHVENAETQGFHFFYGDAGGATNEALATRTLTVTQEAYSQFGGILVEADRPSNGTSMTMEFDIPISSRPATLTALDIDGALLRENGRQVPSVPLFGSLPTASIDGSIISRLTEEAPSTENQTFNMAAGSNEYGYFAFPVGLGQATFVDMMTGMVGGWDGATWPEDGSIGSTHGPRTVEYNGAEWYVYRTDYTGVNSPFMVSFQNPGLPVGASGMIPHLMSSPEGLTYTVKMRFDQVMPAAPSITPTVGEWSSEWRQEGDALWVRDLTVRNSHPRGDTEFTNFSASSASGNPVVSELVPKYVIAGFTPRVVTFPALSRIAPIGVPVYNVVNTSARYSGSSDDLALRTDTRDAQASYSIVDSEGNYTASGGTHIWLSDSEFSASNTTGTLKVDIEESP